MAEGSGFPIASFIDYLVSAPGLDPSSISVYSLISCVDVLAPQYAADVAKRGLFGELIALAKGALAKRTPLDGSNPPVTSIPSKPSDALSQDGMSPGRHLHVRSLEVVSFGCALNRNRRLERLGEAVLCLSITNLLEDFFSELETSFVIDIRSNVLSDAVLCDIADRCELPGYDPRKTGSEYDLNRARMLKAYVGAVYTEQGFDEIHQLIIEIFTPPVYAFLNGKRSSKTMEGSLTPNKPTSCLDPSRDAASSNLNSVPPGDVGNGRTPSGFLRIQSPHLLKIVFLGRGTTRSQRLEWLGDAFLYFSVTLLLEAFFFQSRTSHVSHIREWVLSNAFFSKMEEYYCLSTCSPAKGRSLNSARLFEAYIGALYTEQGFDKLHQFIAEVFTEPLCALHDGVMKITGLGISHVSAEIYTGTPPLDGRWFSTKILANDCWLGAKLSTETEKTRLSDGSQLHTSLRPRSRALKDGKTMNGTMLTLGSWQKLSEARRESRRRYATRQDDQAPDPADTTSRDDAPDQMDESSAPSAGEDGEAFEKAKPLPNTVSQPMITPPKGREIQSVLPSGVQESQAAVPEKPSTRRKSKKKAEKEDLMEILSSLLEDAEEVPHAGEQQSTGSENAKTPGKRKRGDEERTAIMATVHRQKRRKPRKRNGMDS